MGKRRKVKDGNRQARALEEGHSAHKLSLINNRWECSSCGRSVNRKDRAKLAKSECKGRLGNMNRSKRKRTHSDDEPGQQDEKSRAPGAHQRAGSPKRKRGRAAPSAPD